MSKKKYKQDILKDISFLKEIKEKLEDVQESSYDRVGFEYVYKMIDDWIRELEEAQS